MFQPLHVLLRHPRLMLVMLAAGLCTTHAGLARTALAQHAEPKFHVFSVPAHLADDQKGHKALKQQKNQVVLGRVPLSAGKSVLDEWYNQYFFRSFTLPQDYHKLPEKRRELLQDFAQASRQDLRPVYQYLLERTQLYMQGYVQDTTRNFHPAVRFNAMLVIGELNSPDVGTRKNLPIPLDWARQIMVDQLANPNQIDAVKVAALLGILRHAKLDWGLQPPHGLPSGIKKAMADQMVALLDQTDPPAHRNRAGHVWMQRRAVEVLAALKLLGQWDVANAKVQELVSNPQQDLLLRCTAARALELFHGNGAARLDLADTSRNLGALAVAASRHELDWVDQYKLKKAAKESPPPPITAFADAGAGAVGVVDEAAMMMGVDKIVEEDDQSTGFEGMGGSVNIFGENTDTEKDPEVVLARRRLLTKLICIQKGLDGLAAAASPEEKMAVEQVITQFDALVNATTPPEDEPNLNGYVKSVRRAMRDLDRLTRVAPPPAAPDTPPVSAAASLP